MPAAGQGRRTFVAAYKEAYNADPATYSAEGYDAANVFLDGIAAGKTDRADMVDYVKSYDKPGRHQAA